MHACVLRHFSWVWLFATLWITARQAPLSMGFPRQQYWSGLPYPPSGDLPGPGSNLSSLMSPALAGWFFTTIATWEALSDRLVIQVSIELGNPSLLCITMMSAKTVTIWSVFNPSPFCLYFYYSCFTQFREPVWTCLKQLYSIKREYVVSMP